MNKEKIKIMIVEDSITMRNFLFQAFSDEKDIEIVSYASNGKLALPRIQFYKPDFIILDYEMPMMNGLETIKEIQNLQLPVKIIMFSAYTLEGAEITIEALRKGATDFVPKPQGKNIDPESIVPYIKKNLIEKIYTLSRLSKDFKQNQTLKEITKEIKTKKVPTTIEIAGIGISTGGPLVLHEIFSKLPKIKKTLLIVQHMPSIFTQKLAESLDHISKTRVIEAQDQMPLESETVYIAPGGLHMMLDTFQDKIIIRTLNLPPKNNCKPSVDYLFESLAKIYGNRALGIIMTGMGTDGFEGLKKMYEKNSHIIAQSPESCTVFGMPKKPIQENIVTEILDIEGIIERLKFFLC